MVSEAVWKGLMLSMDVERLEDVVSDIHPDNVVVYELKSLSEQGFTTRQINDMYRQATLMQGVAWKEHPFEWVPPHQMQGTDKIGGSTHVACVRINENGAVDENSQNFRVLGMSYDVIGEKKLEGKIGEIFGGKIVPLIYNHLIGSDSDYKSGNGQESGHQKKMDIGAKIRLKQRQDFLGKGKNLMAWTYDPLVSENANLYIRKCGAVVSEYHDEAYELQGVNAGTRADRFFAVWFMDSDVVRHRCGDREQTINTDPSKCNYKELDDKYRPFVQEASNNIIQTIEEGPFRRIADADKEIDADELALEIPSNFVDMKDVNNKLASEWRDTTAELFKTYFRKGYVVNNFVDIKTGADKRRCYYILKKDYIPVGSSKDY
jgi:predicted GNAT superfamily acetyltransferase